MEMNCELPYSAARGGTGKTFVSVNLTVSVQGRPPMLRRDKFPAKRKVARFILFVMWIVMWRNQTGTCFSSRKRYAPNRFPSWCRRMTPRCVTAAASAPIFADSTRWPMCAIMSKSSPSCATGATGACCCVPPGAMSESARVIGEVACGQSDGIDALTGTLNPGEATGVPVIQSLVHMLDKAPALVTVLDCPPGSGCAVMECIRESDYCVLVAEPTTFGLHDMGMVAELVRLMDRPAGLLFNRCSEDSAPLVREAAEREGMPLLGTLPFDSKLAGAAGRGWRSRTGTAGMAGKIPGDLGTDSAGGEGMKQLLVLSGKGARGKPPWPRR